ncbi:hypothetical protein C0991_005265 [Blastosporella zonata]|nr:hypothetical protein C0991_005265 [Blastosporella zonata]
MTSLRTFQTEIEEIHQRELLKQRTHPPITDDKEKDKPRENQTAPASAKGKVKDDGPTNDNGVDTAPKDLASARSGMHEVEEKILTLLLSRADADHDAARDLVAALLTQHRGEYVLRIGSQPSHAHLFAGDLTDASDGWTGTARTVEELDTLKEKLTHAVEEVGGKTSVLFETRTGHPRISLLLRLPPPNVSLTPEVRCAVVGNVDSGKSTTLGVLTRGVLDDGRGRARVWLFRHKHEVETGRTSSVGMEILGFGPSGAAILPNTANTADLDAMRHEKLGWEEISVQAAKIVSFIGANAGLIGMSKEHLAIALALSVPVVVCITKIDMTPPNKTEETIKHVVKILKSPGCRMSPVFVKDIETAVELSTSFGSERMCPIFQISNVTGSGLDFVRTFLNLLPSSEHDNEKFAVDQPLEFSITEVWSVPYVGTVVNGIVNSGSAKIGDTVLLGPDEHGKYLPTVIKDMQRKRVPVTTAEAGQCVSFALKRVKRAAVRKGMVLLPKTELPPRSTLQFEGQVLILYHNTTLQKGYQAMLHCGAVRQTVRIVEMDNPEGVLRTGDRATVKFEFISHPEFVKEGMKLLFREGKTKTSNADTPYPTLLPQQSGIAASYSLSPDPRQWGSDLSVNLVEPDDELHNPPRGFNATSIERGGSIFSARGIMNFGCLFILGAGLLALL